MRLPRQIRNSKGFTLIELIVVIAVLGVLAVVLITTIDPLDKISSANDAGVISTVSQLGRANDSYALSHSNTYVGPAGTTAFSGLLGSGPIFDLNAAGETKQAALTAPSGYIYNYLAGPATCTTSGATKCTSYVIYVNPLGSKKYSGTKYYWWANGRGCFQAAAPANSTDACP